MKKMAWKKHKFNLAKHVILTAIICSAYGHAYALPTGEQVQAGSVGFVRDAQSLNINQASQQAIVNWQSFGIAANEAIKLYQPNQGSALFRVIGTDPSQIFGSLTATGSLFLINPNGVLFAPGAQVNVGSLLVTTMQMSDQNFLAKNYQFNGNSNASVINQGVIRATDGGYLVLLGNTVKNSGTLQANNGSVVLGSAQSAMLDFYGDGLVRVKLDGDALNAAIKQSGNINADGGAVQLATNARTAAINVDGVVQANSLVERNGVIRLEGGKGSTVQVSGKLIAKGNSTGLKGGEATVTGERVALLDGSKVDVSGSAGGGTALIGGDYQGKNANIQNADRTYVANTATIKADALDSGDGGKVVVWANDITRYFGNISAKGGANGGNGGFAEVSGKRLLNFLGKVDLSAAIGVGGNLLLDPSNITLSTGADTNTTGFTPPGDITEAFADDGASNSVFNVTAGTGSFAGITAGSIITLQATNNITVANAFNIATATGSANNSLVLQANNNITLNAGATVTASGTGTVTMQADADNSGVGAVALNAGINTAGGAVNLSGATMSSAAAGTINSAGGAVNLNTSTGTSTLSGVVSGAGTSINKNGAGTINLTGANAYTGATNVNLGTLGTSGGAIPNTSAVTVAAGATFSVNAADIIGSLAGAGNAVLAGNLTAGGDNTSTTFSGLMSGTSAFTKAGTGTLTLSGVNTYTGTTTISAGTLALDATGTIAASSSVANNSNFTIAANKTIDSMTGAGATVLGGILTIGDASNTSSTYSGVMSGAGGLTKAGTGTLTLGGVNTYTGATTINAGILALNAAGTIAASSGVQNNATFSIAAAKTIDSMTGAGATVLGGSILTIGDASNTSSTYSGVASGTGGITKAGTGTLTLSGVNTYTGATTISAGTLQFVGGAAIADTSAVTLANVAGATLDLNGTNETIGSLAGGGAAGGNVTLGAGILTTGGNNTSTTYSGVMSGAGGLTKVGTGVMTLSGANTYTGTTTVTAGTLTMGASNAFADASTILVNGGILDGNTRTDTVAGVRLDSGSITGTAGALTSTTAYDLRSGTVSKILGGAVGLNKTTAGTVTLSGANTFTGATAINAGTIIASNANALGAIGGGTTVVNGATLNVNAVPLAETAITINGTGVASAGALSGTGAAGVNGTVTTASDSIIGTTSPASTLSLNGVVTAANNLGIAGAGNVTATNAANNFSTINITGANNVNLRDSNAIILGNSASNLTGNLTLQTAGAITQTSGLTVGGTATLNAGAANDIVLNNAGNNFNAVAITSGRDVSLVDANAMTINASSVRTISARTLSNDLTLGGNIIATGTGSGTSITLASAQNFLNPGNSAITPGAGSRWLVYSANPMLDTRGAGLITASNFKQYNTLFGGAISGAGNGFVYSVAPTITATLMGSATKTYSGNTTAPVGSLTLGQSGAIDGDTVNLSALSSATYDNKNAGVNKTVTSNALSITSATNGAKQVFGYQLSSTNATGNVGTINKASLAINAVTDTKTYDGTTTSAGVVSVGPLFGTDTVTGAVQAFASKNALGVNGSILNVTGFTLNDGNSGNNYTVTNATAAGTINQRPITITANPGQSKVFGSADPLPFTYTVGSFGLAGGDTLVGALDRAVGETVGSYAINQGTLFASPNYQLTYFSNNFSILVPSTTGGGGSNPRNSSGLVDLNPMLSNYTNQQLFVLNVGYTAAGDGSTGNQEACEEDPESLVKDKDFILMLNYGLKLPKGVNASCDKTSI